MNPNQLHPTLAADCHVLGSLDLSLVLLHRCTTIPWFILVPDTTQTELYTLETSMRHRVMESWNDLSRFAATHFKADKMNTGAIGNVVPQLHLHVIVRKKDDPFWPGVVWGQPMEKSGYDSESLNHLTRAMIANLAGFEILE